VWIKIILIVALAVLALLLLRTSQGARHQAIRRLLLLLFAVVTVGSVLVPDLWNRLAHKLGVGRGSDLLLYGLIVAFLGYTVTSYMRFRAVEQQLTRLARRLALDEAMAGLAASPDVPPGARGRLAPGRGHANHAGDGGDGGASGQDSAGATSRSNSSTPEVS
jgi:hypothetical protein